MKTTVRKLQPSDMESFADLCASREKLCRSDAEKRAEVVEWVAFHNPVDDGQPTYFVGARGDRVLAHMGRMPTQFFVKGLLVDASFFHDLYVHPEIRKEKASGFFLSMKLYRACEKASPSFGAMVWTNQINISLQKARKYKQMWFDRRVMLLGAHEKFEKHLPGIPAAMASRGFRASLALANRANEWRLKAQPRQIVQFERFDERFDELSERCARTSGISARKDHLYLNWKYVDRPHLQTSNFQLLDASGKLAGYCVVVDPDESKTASIAEIVTVDRDRMNIHALLSQAISYLRQAGADRIEAVASDMQYSQALHERWFRRDLRMPLFLTGSEDSPHRAILHQASNWHVNLGDSEGPF